MKPPWHASATESLELEIFVDPDQMTQFFEAFSVHSTDELPMKLLTEEIFEFIGGKELEVLITPSVVTSDKSLETLEPSDRSCFFKSERKLRFFKIYTKRNCEIECFSNYSRKICNCVAFDIVRDSDARVCGVTKVDLNCQETFRKDFRDPQPNGMLKSCSCFSLCDSVSYNIEVRESKLNVEE